MVDFVCDLNCHSVPGLGVLMGFCCRACQNGHKDHINDSNKHLWTEENGFASRDGCRLPRDQMPPECRQYDCKKYGFYVCSIQYKVMRFDGQKWSPNPQATGNLVGWVDTGSMEQLSKEIRRRLEGYNNAIPGITHPDGQEPAKTS